MNQTDLIQKIMEADRQAEAISQDAKFAADHLDENIEKEIQAMEETYKREAEEQLAALKRAQEEQAAVRLQALDQKLETTLGQVEALYRAKKEEWVDSIVERIVGKAGD